MSVTSIGTGAGTASTALDRQLRADQKVLQDDQQKKAAQATLAADLAQIQTDQLAITTARSATKASQAATGSAAFAASGSEAGGTPPQVRESVDIYL